MSLCTTTSRIVGFALLAVVALITFSTETRAALTENQLALLENIIYNKTFKEGNVTGMSISIVQGDNFNDVFSRGYGFKDLENGLEATNRTLFGIGSLSKMISSLLVVKILNDKFPDSGEGVLDKPIRELAPDFNFTLIDRYRSEYATFRDLLAHKVCVQKSTEIAGLMGAFESKEDVVYRQRFCPQQCGFRHPGWHYNNVMVHVAAEAAASVHGTGEAFEDLLEKFFKELGMIDTQVIRNEIDYETLPNMSKAYYWRDNAAREFNISLIKRSAYFTAVGGILTTSNDMANYMAVLGTNGKRMDGTQVVAEHVMKWVTRNSNPYLNPAYKSAQTDRPRGDSAYGIGVILGTDYGYQRLRHIGYIAPYTSIMNVYPKLKLGIFTATNGPSRFTNHDQIHNQLVDIIRGFITEPTDAEDYVPSDDDLSPDPEEYGTTDLLEQMARFHPIKKLAPEEFESTLMLNHSDLVGLYGNTIGGNFEISDVNETALYLKYGDWGRGLLIKRNETIYDAVIDTDLAHNWYAENKKMPSITADFSTPMTCLLGLGSTKVPYFKGFSIRDLPSEPWKEGSCGYQ